MAAWEGTEVALASDHDPLLTLQEAADRLKVHYMTAYRWVRKGDLPAFKTGGRLRLRESDVDAFVSRREVDTALPPEQPSRTDWPLHIDRLYNLFLSGDGRAAYDLVSKVVADGAPVGEVYIKLLAPALHRIGEEWAAGRINVVDEHRASEISNAIIARMGQFFVRRGPSRGVAVTVTPPGEQHGIGAAMTAQFLRGAGFEVHHLGANVPIEDLRLFLEVTGADLVCISVTTPLERDMYARLVDVARSSGDAAVVFGGQGVDPEAAERAGARVVEELADLPELVQRTAG